VSVTKGRVMAGKTTAKTSAPARRQALVVAGMHRSGTSAMARLLSLSGATLPERVMDPGPDNPMGYWEPWEMVALDDEILETIDSRWDNVFAIKDDDRAWAVRDQFLGRAKDFLTHNFGDQDLLVMKDPRSSILVRFWRQALDEIDVDPVYVIMVRHPLEVAESLSARSGSPLQKSLMLWTSYMLAVERDTREAPRLFVSYSDLLNDWRGVLGRIEAALGQALPPRAPGVEAEIEQFLSKSHRHHEADVSALDAMPDVWPGAQTTYRWMLEAAQGVAPASEALAMVEADLNRLEKTMGPVLAEQRQQLRQIPIAQAEAVEAREERTRMEFQLADVRQEAADLKFHFDKFHAESDARHQDAMAAIAHHQEATEQWKREVESERAKVGILRDRVATAERDTLLMKSEAESQQAQLQAVFASTSWRVTRPLRAVVRRLRRS
jgi:hypothetical protein